MLCNRSLGVRETKWTSHVKRESGVALIDYLWYYAFEKMLTILVKASQELSFKSNRNIKIYPDDILHNCSSGIF